MTICECGFSRNDCVVNPCRRKRIHFAGLTPDSKWPKNAPIAPPTGCSCHPDDNPSPCPQKHALSECREAVALNALANRINELTPHWAKSPDGAEWQMFVITVSPTERNRIMAALRSQGEPTMVMIPSETIRMQEQESVDRAAARSKNDFRWLIEAPGARYLAVQRLSMSDNFEWTTDHNKAIAFRTQEQADAVMMAVRQMDRAINGFDKGLFAFEANLGNAKAVEHGWL